MSYTNTSWGGSRVSGNPKGTAHAACSDKRIEELGRDGDPDIIICHISSNDWRQKIVIGNWQPSDGIDISQTQTISELRKAYALMLYKLEYTFPKAKIFCTSILDDYKYDTDKQWPSEVSTAYTWEWNKNIEEIAKIFGATYINLGACGLNFINIRQFSTDSGLHPNKEGQKMMADFIQSQIISHY